MKNETCPDPCQGHKILFVYLHGIDGAGDFEKEFWINAKNLPGCCASKKNKIIVEEETLIAEKYLERLIETWESTA